VEKGALVDKKGEGGGRVGGERVLRRNLKKVEGGGTALAFFGTLAVVWAKKIGSGEKNIW